MMIWVIGDVHGMIGPLERILGAIRDYHEKVEATEKIIFIGDFVDHGLRSREVIDAVLGLEFPKVCLMGNHDDMGLRFFRHVKIYENTGDLEWLKQGGLATVRSFLSNTDKLGLFNEIYNKHYDDWDCPKDAFEEARPPEKYTQFLESLRYSHRETLDCGYAKVTFRFFHALPRQDQSLEEQSVEGFDDFQSYMARPFRHLGYGEWRGDSQFKKSFHVKDGTLYTPEETIIWFREHNFRFAYEGDVVVHGHTPTVALDGPYARDWHVAKDFRPIFQKYPLASRLPFLFSRDKSAGYGETAAVPRDGEEAVFNCGDKWAVEAINVDTGSVYKWGALTALGLSEKRLQKGELPVLTALTSPGDRPTRDSARDTMELLKESAPEKGEVILRTVKTGRLGADLADKARNPVFPVEEFRNQALKSKYEAQIPGGQEKPANEK